MGVTFQLSVDDGDERVILCCVDTANEALGIGQRLYEQFHFDCSICLDRIETADDGKYRKVDKLTCWLGENDC